MTVTTRQTGGNKSAERPRHEFRRLTSSDTIRCGTGPSPEGSGAAILNGYSPAVTGRLHLRYPTRRSSIIGWMSSAESPSAGEAAAADVPVLVAVLDMGASAIRLAVAEIVVGHPPRIVEELSRRVSLGRDSFSSGGAIRSRTGDAVIAAVDGFCTSMELHGVSRIRAAATSAVREARNGDVSSIASGVAPASISTSSSTRRKKAACCTSR